MNGNHRQLLSQSIRFQLTSLMDLLLIIVFAQYLEFHSSQTRVEENAEREVAEARQLAQGELDAKLAELDRLRQRIEQEKAQLQSQRDASLSQAADADRRLELTQNVIKRLLDLDADVVDSERSSEESLAALDDASALSSRISEMDGAQLLRFLVGYDELLKRADLWTIHVSDRGDIEIVTGPEPDDATSFRLEGQTQPARTASFIQQMRTAYSQMQQPQAMVILLVSYSPRAIAGNFQPVLDGLPNLVDQLEADFDGRTRFEFSVIGAVTDPARDLP